MSSKLSKIVLVRVDPVLRARLEAQATAKRTTLSALIRPALRSVVAGQTAARA